MAGFQGGRAFPPKRFAALSRLLRRIAVTGLGALGLGASVDAHSATLKSHPPTVEPAWESRGKRSRTGKLVLRLGGSMAALSLGHGSHRSHSSHSSHASHYSGSGGGHSSPTPAPRPPPRSTPAPIYTPSPIPSPPPRPAVPGAAQVGIDASVTIEAIDSTERKVTAKLASGQSQEFFYSPTVEIVRHKPSEVKIQLDQLLALAPDAFPLHIGQKIIVTWTFAEHKRVALRFTLGEAAP